MKDELQKQLFDKYPDLFKEKDLPPSQSNMCFGFECDGGWYNLIDTLCSLIQNEQTYRLNQKDSNYSPVRVNQVKEKFGMLTIYYRGGDDYTDGIFRMAQTMSACTCEVCGNSGYANKSGWIKTLCDKHHEEREALVCMYACRQRGL